MESLLKRVRNRVKKLSQLVRWEMYSTVSQYVNHACEILILHFPDVFGGNLTTDVLSEFQCVLILY